MRRRPPRDDGSVGNRVTKTRSRNTGSEATIASRTVATTPYTGSSSHENNVMNRNDGSPPHV